ncbi:MAG: hypothetical protein PVG37_08380, partial [Desulfobacterales bacterium]
SSFFVGVDSFSNSFTLCSNSLYDGFWVIIVSPCCNQKSLEMFRSGFKTSPQAQFLCWTEGFNTQNIKYIPAFESLAPP